VAAGCEVKTAPPANYRTFVAQVMRLFA